MVMMRAPLDLKPKTAETFKQKDLNNDGKLSYAEFKGPSLSACGHPGGCRCMPTQPKTELFQDFFIREEFEALDKNKDGSLSLEEYLPTKQPAPESKPAAQAAPPEPKQEKSGGFLGFLKKLVPFAFPAVGAGILAKKGAENLVKNTTEEGSKGILKQIGLSIVAPPLAALNFFKKLF